MTTRLVHDVHGPKSLRSYRSMGMHTEKDRVRARSSWGAGVEWVVLYGRKRTSGIDRESLQGHRPAPNHHHSGILAITAIQLSPLPPYPPAILTPQNTQLAKMFGAAPVPGSRQGCFKCGNRAYLSPPLTLSLPHSLIPWPLVC
jgi:hypothetical protein